MLERRLYQLAGQKTLSVGGMRRKIQQHVRSPYSPKKLREDIIDQFLNNENKRETTSKKQRREQKKKFSIKQLIMPPRKFGKDKINY